MERENNPAKNREGKPDGSSVANRIDRMLAVEPPTQAQRDDSRDDEKNDATGVVDVHRGFLLRLGALMISILVSLLLGIPGHFYHRKAKRHHDKCHK